MTDLWISTALQADAFTLGESIAVDGVCLTVVEREAGRFRVQAAPETLSRSTLGGLSAGQPVNLERALTLADRLGGHLVQGHVDATSRIEAERKEGGSRVLRVELPPALAAYFIEKGSVAISGVSLTVSRLLTGFFEVMLIPETQSRTTLGTRRVGERVNLEADLIGKYVARLHALRSEGTSAGGVSEAQLKAAGFGKAD